MSRKTHRATVVLIHTKNGTEAHFVCAKNPKLALWPFAQKYRAEGYGPPAYCIGSGGAACLMTRPGDCVMMIAQPH